MKMRKEWENDAECFLNSFLFFYLKTSKNTPILFRWGMNCVPFKLYNLIDYDILSVITDRKAENIWNLTQIIIQYSN